ncbi:DoxX family protein [Paraflavitalea speifideaquila]|uniref:DoxX family protein n=1 Tax=Paraflavitalea speifideaquila TaxID=3076558 RepID=UPI0028E1F845|nr:DoxX family protein [Paraflavitalea speifideiaquila]
MKKINTFYWICTGLITLALGAGSILELFSNKDATQPFIDLGYPTYLAPFLSLARLLGLAVILVPGYPRLKEWAYAGLAFDMIGALYSHLALAKPAVLFIGIILPLLFLIGSYILYHKKLALALSGRF